jgi:hypothetical protein
MSAGATGDDSAAQQGVRQATAAASAAGGVHEQVGVAQHHAAGEHATVTAEFLHGLHIGGSSSV